MYKIKNIGKTKTFVYNGLNKPQKKNDIEWSIDYDNKNGVDLNINMDNNGDKSHYHQYLTNSELEELLKMSVVDKSIHQRLLEDFNPYNNSNDTNNMNNNLDLITYPHRDIQQYKQPYTMQNDLMNYNQIPMHLLLDRPSELMSKSREKPKIIKIKIYTKKHKKHKNHSNSRIRKSHKKTRTKSYSSSSHYKTSKTR
jgi:hypothetical protein